MYRGKETRALSLESSPVASSRMSVSSRESLSKPDGDGQDHDGVSQVKNYVLFCLMCCCALMPSLVLLLQTQSTTRRMGEGKRMAVLPRPNIMSSVYPPPCGSASGVGSVARWVLLDVVVDHVFLTVECLPFVFRWS